MIKWTLEKRKISDLKYYTKNPRTLSKDQEAHLRQSLINFGQCEPIVITIDNLIIGGHQRARTLKKIGYKEVDCYVPDVELTEKQVEELCLRLNRVHGSFNYDDLCNNFDISDLLSYGFTLDEFDIPKDIDNEEKESFKCPTCGKKCKEKIEV